MKKIQLVKFENLDAPTGELIGVYDSDEVPFRDDTITFEDKLYLVRSRNYDSQSNVVTLSVAERQGEQILLFLKKQKDKIANDEHISEYLKLKTCDINFMSDEDNQLVINYLYNKYPKDKYKITYHYTPFTLGYAIHFGIAEREVETDDVATNARRAFNSIPGKEIYNEISHQFPHLSFDELVDTRIKEIYGFPYAQYDKLENFLRTIGYEFPLDRIVRYAINPFTKEKLYYKYSTNGNLIKSKKNEDSNTGI